jgi:hypothetical protein
MSRLEDTRLPFFGAAKIALLEGAIAISRLS